MTNAVPPGRWSARKLAVASAEVLSVRAAEQGRVAASLRVTARQAVYLAAAQAFARDIRLLPRPAGEPRGGPAGLTVSDRL